MGEIKAEDLLDTVVRRGEAGGLVGEDAVRVLARGGVKDELGRGSFLVITVTSEGIRVHGVSGIPGSSEKHLPGSFARFWLAQFISPQRFGQVLFKILLFVCGYNFWTLKAAKAEVEAVTNRA